VERKLATVLFVDLVDSTSLVTSADPEVVRRRVSQYFDLASRVIEQHGGTVEKFAGDAVMAAFGVPRAHEDDAVRAVRAACSVLEGIHDLELEARAGIESGEVVVDAGESTFVTGEAVNVAARLQQSAPVGAVVIGPGTRRLTLADVEVEDHGPVEVRGRGEVWSWVALRVGEGRRRPRARFVGRTYELELLRNLYERAVRDRHAHLVTVFGDAGVGKSRLVSEFADGVERATILTGRALPYGEGIGYWAVASMIKASAGITDDDPAAEAFEKLRVSCESDAVADLLAVALGVLGAAESGDGAGEEIAWAALRWCEQLAEAQPVVLVFEDLQWADERLLDLIEHLARSLRGAPVLIVCIARNELLDVRPAWGGGNPRAAAVELEPLSPDEAREFADELLPRDTPPGVRSRVLEQAEGNPLFLEETAWMLLEGDGAGGIPDTLQTLIAARIDLLSREAKQVLQSAAVIGRVFWRGALETLEVELDVPTLLELLADRELIVAEERSAISGDRAFRFRHVLIRDVAYATVTKAERATLHRRFAAWVAERTAEDVAAIRAYHLDRACTLLAELDGRVQPELAAEAAAALEEAGERALRGSAFVNARRLFRRAFELEPVPRRRYLAASAAVELGDLGAVATEMEAVRELAVGEGDAFLHGRALNALAFVALARDGDAVTSEALAHQALETLPEDDVDGRAVALFRLASATWWPGNVRRAETYVRRVLEIADEHGRLDLRRRALRMLLWLLEVRLELDEAAEVLEAVGPPGDDVLERARTKHAEAGLYRLQGRLDDAAAAFEEARELFHDAGLVSDATWSGVLLGWIAYVRDDLDQAERAFRDGVRVFGANEDFGHLCEAERALAEVLLERGRVDEAEQLALSARVHVGNHDVTSSTATLRTLGLVRAAQGRLEEAEMILREALSTIQGTDCRLLEVAAVVVLSRFLRSVGCEREAEELDAQLPERIPGWLNEVDRHGPVTAHPRTA
jgi:class 3 adenylate cyclase/tetratricopeptide (TPR) repeat protein/Arc/MetJ family transcription regulator